MLKLLDTTLRDGSYIVDFQFTARDTSAIAQALDTTGIHFIEVGHGLGLNATTNPKMKAACIDEEYLEAAAESIKNSKWGMFFIPGIGRLEDIDLAARYKMDFIRIGTNVSEVANSEPFIRRAKDLGFQVFSNFMKTYAMDCEEVGKLAKKVTEWGTDVVSVVDSSGGMFPEDIERYFNAIRRYCDVTLGFHGHNNLGLVIANCLKAIDCGCGIIDVSLRGIGRDSGNVATEIFLLVLKRKGIDLSIEPLKMMNIAESVIDPILKNFPQVHSLGIVSGYAQFHSSFLKPVLAFAEKYNVDPRELIIYISQEDKINPSPALIEKLAKSLSSNNTVPRQIFVSFPTKKDNKSGSFLEKAVSISLECHSIARKYGKTSVFNLFQPLRSEDKTFVSSAVYSGEKFVVGSAQVSNSADAADLIKTIDGKSQIIFIDGDLKTSVSKDIVKCAKDSVTQSQVLFYSDLETWTKSIILFVSEKIPNLEDANILVLGDNKLATLCFVKLSLLSENVVWYRSMENIPQTSIISAFVLCEAIQDFSLIETFPLDGFIIDALIGSLMPDSLKTLHEKGIQVFRPDMRNAIHSELASVVGMKNLVSDIQGVKYFNEIRIAAGGIIAPRGTVIVDSVNKPTTVFGIADGKGFLVANDEISKEYLEMMKIVEDNLCLTIG